MLHTSGMACICRVWHDYVGYDIFMSGMACMRRIFYVYVGHSMYIYMYMFMACIRRVWHIYMLVKPVISWICHLYGMYISGLVYLCRVWHVCVLY